MGSEMVSIKGTKNGLVIFLDPNREFDEIKKTLHIKMESARGFFKGAKVTFSEEHTNIPADQKNELEKICRQYGLEPTEYKPPATRQLSRNASQVVSSVQSHNGEAALMVRRSLRSGQRISYPGHIVVIGDVHPGAEVISGGNILIMGSCRGHIHAGAGGNRYAKVIARRLNPTVLSIADRRHSPERFDKVLRGYMSARLSGQEIVFERYNPGR